MPTITYGGQPVAIGGQQRVFIVPTIAHRPDTDRLKQFVCHPILYADDVQAGRLAGEPHRYLPERGERYVRAQLVPARRFLDLLELPDLQLADVFGVPTEQIAERRCDLAPIVVDAERRSGASLRRAAGKRGSTSNPEQ